MIVTPVGFKFLAELFLDQKINPRLRGKRGTLGAGHLPEKDGILTCALVAEMLATRKEPIKVLLEQLYKTYGFRAASAGATSTANRWLAGSVS